MAYYNFLPPFDQIYPDLPAQGNRTIPLPTGIGNINRLDQYISPYNITTGELIELQIDGSNIPTNLTGTVGPTGPGLSGDPPPATPFMMVTYGQTSQGIVQFTLIKGSSAYIPDGVPLIDIDKTYLFAPINDTLDYSRVVQLYYTIDTTQNGVNGAPSGNTNAIRFFDAERVQQNPTSSIYNYELVGNTSGLFKSDNSYAIWPFKQEFFPTVSTGLYFYFNELVNKINVNQQRIFSGQFYHPYFIGMTGIGSDVPDGYIDYAISSYYSGYGPGYPVNINYQYAPISPAVRPVIENGIDNIFQTYDTFYSSDYTSATFTGTWPGPVSLNMYNFSTNNIVNMIGSTQSSEPVDSSDTSDILNVINDVCNNSFLPCDCNNNNFCTGNSSNSYNTVNQNTIQAGIANYLIYQFIPFNQIKTPSSFIVTDPNNIGNTGYAYATLPTNGLGQPFPPTPLGISGNQFYGSYSIQSQGMIDTTIGPTGTTQSNPSIISGWINNPLSLSYQCNREVSTNSTCGFLDYFDSLFGVAYNYGTCGATGATDPYQKGACPSNQICVPNFDFLQLYDTSVAQPYICVSGATGVSYNNLSNYTTAVPPKTQFTARQQEPQYGVQKLTAPVEKTTGTDNIWLYIGIILAVIVIAVVIFILARGFKSSPSYSNYAPVRFT
jgi:hypothetical protein